MLQYLFNDIGGHKGKLPSACASVIIADLDIISRAPMKMLQAGLGDMLAKYISICNGEFPIS